jgi:hypothetical protein
MKRQTTVLAAAAGLFLSGCVVTSLHPYYSVKDVVFEPALVGQWTNTQQSHESWTFEKQGLDSYKLTFVSEGKTNLALAYLFKLKEERFLDFESLDPECSMMPPPIPSHFLQRVDQVSPTLRLAPINHDWLMALLEKEPKAVQHVMIGQKGDDRRAVLTAETAELQQFIIKHLKTSEAWKDWVELKRVGK